jgi:hypothetical protein
MRTTFFLLGLLTACADSESPLALQGPCGDMCRDLVQDCQYAAFPTIESCFEGCLYAEDQGADVDAQATCISGAVTDTCDTFAILECEHAHGIF